MSTAPRPFWRIRYRTAILLLVLAMVLWSGFSYWSEYSENAARRARDLLAPPQGPYCAVTLDVEGRQRLFGTIVEQSERWIVLRETRGNDAPTVPGRTVWIPRERVLLIEISP
jgi:hypothetical protein